MDQSKYTAVPKEIAITSESRFDIEESAEIVRYLLSAFEGDKFKKASLSASLLWEYMIKVDWRFTDITVAIDNFSEASQNEDPMLRNRQLQFVDRVESFHRQIYATLSVFILFLSHSAPIKISSQIPIRSVQKFIKYLQGQALLNDNSHFFNQLLDSVDYRAYFIDHPQQSKLCHWLTMGLPQETVVIHYVPLYCDSPHKDKFDSVENTQYTNPRLPNFWPFVRCSSFRVSPNSSETFRALYSTIKNVLIWCKGIKDENS